ncbi:MAG: serine/threonine protein kinase, partial [Anaerolineaceae bacterium]|nr:serine/threonine protein kinase [Anaerolineaceae bacterium]
MADLCGVTLKNQYYLRQLVGSGGMADVYEAWDGQRSAQVALKVLRRDLEKNPRVIRMFEQEATLLKQLAHPHIVRLYEFEKQDGLYFLVMDWMDGKNLREAITESKTRFTLPQISGILQPVASALAYAHSQNVYHCDVKSANILINTRGEVKLTDFGVAHIAQEVGREGTATHMAPEQFQGKPVDARTDVYSLGVVLYELLSQGQVPFTGENASIQSDSPRELIGWEHLNLRVPSLRHNDRSIPEAVEQVVMTALSKLPQDRYASPLDLWESFEHSLSVKDRAGSSNGPTAFLTDVLP